MAQVRIHELPAKSLPLDGTEVLALDEAGGGEPTAAVTSQGVADLAPQGDALTADPLSQFAATASAQFFSVVTDATGTGLAVGNTSPTLITPDLGTPSALDLANATGLPWASVTGTPTTAVGYGITNGANIDALGANPPSFYLDRANHTGTQASSTISDFDASTRAQVEGTLVAGANVTITPAGSGATRTLTIASTAAGGASDLDGLSDVTLTSPANGEVLLYNGSQWVNAAPPGGGGGTVTEVTGGAGLTGTVTTTGSLDVGAGTGITVNPDDIEINRAIVDTWYVPAAQARQWDGGATGLVPATGRTSLELGTAAQSAAGDFAPAAEGVTNGNSHDHSGGDGAQIAYSSLSGLPALVTDLDGLSDVVITAPATDQVLKYNGSQWVNAAAPGGGGGTVTSVGLSAPVGFDVTGTPVTTAGTLALAFTAGYSLPTDALQADWSTAFTQTRQWDGGATGLNPATAQTSLGLLQGAYQDVGDQIGELIELEDVGGGTPGLPEVDGSQLTNLSIDIATDAVVGVVRASADVTVDPVTGEMKVNFPPSLKSSTWTFKLGHPADPGAGSIGTNGLDMTLAVDIHVSDIDSNGVDRSPVFSDFAIGDRLAISLASDSDNYFTYEVSGLPVDQGTYFVIPVTFVEGFGAQLSNNAIAGFWWNQDGQGSINQTALNSEYVIELGPADADQTAGTIKSYTVTYPGVILTDQDMARVECQIEAPAGAPAIYDVLLNGTTILDANQIRIDAGEVSSATSATPAVWTSTALAKGDVLTFEIIQVGVTPGKGPVFYLPFRKSTN